MSSRAKSGRNTDLIKHYAMIVALAKSFLVAIYLAVSEYYTFKAQTGKVPELEKTVNEQKAKTLHLENTVQSLLDKLAISEKTQERCCSQNTKRIDIIFEESYKAHVHSSGEGIP